MKILILESQYNRLIESEVTEGKHDDKDMKKLRCRTTHLTSKGVKPLQADIADWFEVSRRDVDNAYRKNEGLKTPNKKD